MGMLINAEFRKILTTKLWWALMIPAFLLAFGWAWGTSALTTELISDALDEAFIPHGLTEGLAAMQAGLTEEVA